MLRYKRLLREKLNPTDETKKPMQLRELARELHMPVPSLHNYVELEVLPRVENAQKIADFVGESVSSMFSDDDDLTASLVAAVRSLSDIDKQKLLKELPRVR